MVKQSKPKLIITTVVIKRQRLREEIYKHKDNIAMCYWRGNRSPQRKISKLPSKRSIIHYKIKSEYMNSRRFSKPNLSSAPKPSKLLAPIGLHRILFSLVYRIPQSPIASTKVNLSLPNCFLSTKMAPHRYGYGEIRIWLMYLSRMYQWRG